MSDKLIDISENVGLWVNANGKYGIQSGGRETTITDAEFNRLAMEAPFVQRLIEYARMNYQGDERDYSIYELRQKLLTEIAELEKPA
jgi:hypothetical protein